MPTISVDTTIDKAQRILLDEGGDRHSDASMLSWLNEAQRVIAVTDRTAYVITSAIKLVSGTRQELPDGSILLVDVRRNMGAAGNAPGRAIRRTSSDTLDAHMPDWHYSSPDVVVRHFIYDPAEPTAYYVWPPQPVASQNYVEVSRSAVPPLSALGGIIALDDMYEQPILDYMIYRAFSVDSEFADRAKANAHFASFSLAVKPPQPDQ